MIRLASAQLCYFLATKHTNPKDLICFSNISDETHSREGPFPYTEFGTEKNWNPSDCLGMHSIFSNITNGSQTMTKRTPRIGDIAVISDGNNQTYGIVANHKKSYRDDNYNIIRNSDHPLKFLQVGDIYFAMRNRNILKWIRYGKIVK
jgi:hypothetical protein